MENIDQKSTEIELAYETDYFIEDQAFFEPFEVKRPIGIDGYAWWNGDQGKIKVTKLFDAFKTDYTIHEACISTGISLTQYQYFCKVHRNFIEIKRRCKAVLAIAAKRGLVGDITHKEGFRSRQWYLERKQPHLYGRDIGAYTPPPPEAASKVTAEAYLDEDGKMIISKQTLEVLKKEHGNINEDGEGSEKSGV